MMWLITSKLGRGLMGAMAALAVLGGVYLYGVNAANTRAEIKTLRDTVETSKRIDNADTGTGDFNDDLDWLRKRGGN